MIYWGKDASSCEICHCPCDWTTREFRASRLCPECYDDQPKLKLVPKPLLKSQKESRREIYDTLQVPQG